MPDSAFIRCPFCDHILPPGSVVGTGSPPAPRMMHGRSRSGQTISEHVHPWEPDCDVRGCVSEADYSGSYLPPKEAE